MPSARIGPNSSPYGQVSHTTPRPAATQSFRKSANFSHQSVHTAQNLVPRNSQLTASLRGNSTTAASKPPARPTSRQADSQSRQTNQAQQQSLAQPNMQASAAESVSFHQRPLPGTSSRSAVQKQPSSRHPDQANAQDMHRLPARGTSRDRNAAAGSSQHATVVQSSTEQQFPLASNPQEGSAPSSTAPPAKPSYASKVAVNAEPQVPAPVGQAPHRNKHKHHNNKGKGRQHADSSAGDVAVLATHPSQLNPHAIPFTGHTVAAASAAASSPVAAPTGFLPATQGRSNTQRQQSAAEVQTGSQRHQQHPPFRDSPARMLQSPFFMTSEDSASAESSLGAENRDPAMQQPPAGQKLESSILPPIRPSFMASPFTALNTLPSFTKPLSPSKAVEFPSAFGSQRTSDQQAAAISPLRNSPSARNGSPVKSKQPPTQAPAATSQRATVPPEATDTTAQGGPHSDNPSLPSSNASCQQQPPTLAALAALNGNSTGQQKHAEPPSPTTPLALGLAGSSGGMAKKHSSGKAASVCSDLGFSLLWDDDPFWQVRQFVSGMHLAVCSTYQVQQTSLCCSVFQCTCHTSVHSAHTKPLPVLGHNFALLLWF